MKFLRRLFFLLSLCLPLVAHAASLKIEIVGVKDKALLENIEAGLSIKQQQDYALSSPLRLRYLHEKAPKDIRKALEPFGYYNVAIDSSIQESNNNWVVRYAITLGAPVKVKAVDIQILGEGANDRAFNRLYRRLPLKAGMTLNHKTYQASRQQLLQMAADRGYFDANLTRHEIIVSPEENEAEIYLYLDTGNRYYLGDVTFAQDILDDDFLARFVRFAPGDPYHVNRVLDLQRALYGSEYFAQVDVRPQIEAAENNIVPIRVDLTPNKRNKYGLGVGFGTDTGFRGTLGWERRWVNRRGHHTRTSARVSQIGYLFSSNYIIPGKKPQTDSYEFSASQSEEDVNPYDNQLTQFSASKIFQTDTWQHTYSITPQYEDFTIADQHDQTFYLIPSAHWTRYFGRERFSITRDHGSRLGVEVRGGSDYALSETNFAQAQAQYKMVQPFTKRNRFIYTTLIGGTLVEDFDDLSPTLRFFTGGDQLLRGYDYKSIGSTNADGDVIGGKYVYTNSFEIDQLVYKQWGVAVFYDIGTATNDFSESFKNGVGGGIRWRSPVGPVRLDVARGLDSGGSYQVYVSIGPDL